MSDVQVMLYLISFRMGVLLKIYDPDKGKPLSAYEFAQTLNIDDEDKSIVNFLKQVAGDKAYETDFTQEHLEEIVEEPF